MAAGLPIVTTRVGGIPSLITARASTACSSTRRRADAVARRGRARIVRDGAAAAAADRGRLRDRARAHAGGAGRAHDGRRLGAARRDAAPAGAVGGVTMARRNVCFVLPSLHGGGAERAAVQILNALDPAAWDRSMYLFRTRRAVSRRPSTVASRSRRGDGESRIGRWLALRRFFASTRPDLVVSFLSYFSVLSAASAARIGARVVFNSADADVGVSDRSPTITGGGRGIAALFSLVDAASATAWPTRSSRRRRASPTISSSASASRASAHPASCTTRSTSTPSQRREPSRSMPRTQRRWQQPVDRRGRTAGRRQELSAAASTRSRCCAGRVPARLFILGQGDREARDARADRATGSRRRGALVRLSAQSVEVHRASRCVRAELALRRLRQRAGRGDGVRRSGRRDQLAGHARDRRRDGVDGLLVDRHEPAAVAAGARARADRRRRCGSRWRRRAQAAPRRSRCRRSRPRTTACSRRCWRDEIAARDGGAAVAAVSSASSTCCRR